jgi:glycosyltransferase involved in cell wall biosynthesis
VYPPVSEEKFSLVDEAERQRLRDELGFSRDRVTFVFPSSSHKRKGYPLLEAFFSKTTLPVQLAVIGRPVSSTSPNFRYLGYRKDIENVYRAADYTILASHYEPFGLIGVESVLCGTPAVLASNIACTEVISDEGAPTFNVNDPATLARTIEAAVARAQAGQARLATPREHLRYDPGVCAHIDALLALAPGAGAL